MDVVRPVIIMFLVLTFKALFLGASVAEDIQPYQIEVDTAPRECDGTGSFPLFELPCILGNFVRPILGAFAYVINGAIFVGGLAGKAGVEGAPWWIGTTFTAVFVFCFIWALMALLRGTKT